MKHTREERIEIFVYYRDINPIIIYDRNKQILYVFAIANEPIDIKTLPKDVPARESVQKALENLDNSFDRGVVLRTSFVLDGQDDIVAFIQLPAFVPIVNGKTVEWEDAIIHDIFIPVILPMLSVKELRMLEQVSAQTRFLILKSRAWEIIFEQGFPEIYPGSDIFSDEMINHDPKPDYLKLLDSISKPSEERTFGYPRPYWKLLYEYQLKNNFDGFKYQHDSEDNTMLTHCVAFGRRDCLMLRGGNLEFQLIGGHTIKEIPNTQLYQAVENIVSGAWSDVEEFEKNDSYIFMVSSSLEKDLSCISDADGNIIDQSNLDDKYDAGLIGDDFCYFNNTIMSKKYGLKHGIDPQLRIYTCYNTRSDCFLLMKRKYFTKKIQLCKITQDGHVVLAIFDKIKTYDFKFGTYTFNEHWLVYCTKNRRKIKILSARDGSVQKIILPFSGSRIIEMCIVGDYLHYFSSVEALHVIYNLKTGKKNEYTTHNIAFDYVRMSFMGPILCSNRVPEILWADPNKLKLLGGLCTACGSSSPQYACGNRCGAQYCDTQCQTHDWENHHSLICARAGGGRRERKIHKVMTEFKEGRLKTSAGKTVTDRKQALAIALSEANELK